MNRKALVFGSLVAGSVLAIARSLSAKASSANPAFRSPSRDAGAVYKAIDAYVEGQIRRLNIPGLALAIVEGDQIVHYRGFGRARPGGDAPASHTPFVLGSTVKSITALAVMQLVEAGRVELDAPVQRYLPWFRVADPQASAQMTVRHLLNQTSGLPMIAGMVNLANLDDRPDAAERQARSLATLKLSHPVGTAFEYSNLNYNLLGLIVEATSGETYEDCIQDRIFDPLEMCHSYTSMAAARRGGLAVGHRYWFGHPIAVSDLPLARGSLASGQLISCAEDMAHYLIAHLNGGLYGDVQVLSAAGIDELHRGAAEQWLMGSPLAAYGMGWFVAEIGQTTVVSHGGNVPEFSSYMAILPEQKKGVVLLVNADHWGLPFVLPEVGDGVAALLGGEPPPPIRLGFLPWAMRGQLLIPLFQIAGVLATLRLLCRWRRYPPPGSKDAGLWLRHILLPLIPNLSLAAILGYLHASGLLRYMRLYMPDLSWIIRIGGGFAGLWAILRTGLVLQTLRKPRSTLTGRNGQRSRIPTLMGPGT
jgi:CubicO group peptidase (beta-lactamase class C family)